MLKSFFSSLNPCSKRSTKNSEPSQSQFTDSEASFTLRSEIPKTETSFTFKVDAVEFSKGPRNLWTAENLLREILYTGSIRGSSRKFEDFSHREDENQKYLNPEIPGLVGVIHAAFESHYALTLSVSDFIILVGQGVGAHINENAEKLKKYFVDHEGKETIQVRRDEFVLGEQNDWSTVFGEFAEQIREKVKADVYNVIVDNTSIATQTSRIVSEVTLMEAMKNYFDYGLCTECGIPEITLEGKPEDWQKLKDKVRKLVEMNKDDCLGLKYWLDHLVPVVDKICKAGIERKVDREFWSSIYKHRNGSGGDKITGWITRFFPSLVRFSVDGSGSWYGIRSDMIPKQVCEVPFVWSYFGKKIQMKFTAGFLGAEWNKDLRQVKSAHFWCVTEVEQGHMQ